LRLDLEAGDIKERASLGDVSYELAVSSEPEVRQSMAASQGAERLSKAQHPAFGGGNHAPDGSGDGGRVHPINARAATIAHTRSSTLRSDGDDAPWYSDGHSENSDRSACNPIPVR
jgi:hypothetical protein